MPEESFFVRNHSWSLAKAPHGWTAQEFRTNVEAHLNESTESAAATESPAKKRKLDPDVERWGKEGKLIAQAKYPEPEAGAGAGARA